MLIPSKHVIGAEQESFFVDQVNRPLAIPTEEEVVSDTSAPEILHFALRRPGSSFGRAQSNVLYE